MTNKVYQNRFENNDFSNEDYALAEDLVRLIMSDVGPVPRKEGYEQSSAKGIGEKINRQKATEFFRGLRSEESIAYPLAPFGTKSPKSILEVGIGLDPISGNPGPYVRPMGKDVIAEEAERARKDMAWIGSNQSAWSRPVGY